MLVVFVPHILCYNTQLDLICDDCESNLSVLKYLGIFLIENQWTQLCIRVHIEQNNLHIFAYTSLYKYRRVYLY
jgi:hypothetical protein